MCRAPKGRSMAGFARDKAMTVRGSCMEPDDASLPVGELCCRVCGSGAVGAGLGRAFHVRLSARRALSHAADAGGRFGAKCLRLCAGIFIAAERAGRLAAKRLAAKLL